MSSRRSEGKRALPSLTIGKWLVIVAGFVVFVIVSFVLYVRSADSGYRTAEKHAIRIAEEQGGLTKVTEAVRHTWQETIWIVTGEDAEGEQWIVFELQDQVMRKKAGEFLTKGQMLEKFSRTHSGEPIQIMPAWFGGRPAWEIRYWNENDKARQSLDFYSFDDGSLIRTYQLSIQ